MRHRQVHRGRRRISVERGFRVFSRQFHVRRTGTARRDRRGRHFPPFRGRVRILSAGGNGAAHEQRVRFQGQRAHVPRVYPHQNARRYPRGQTGRLSFRFAGQGSEGTLARRGNGQHRRGVSGKQPQRERNVAQSFHAQLMYRLDKIERVMGLNLRKFSDAVTFRIITILFKLVK